MPFKSKFLQNLKDQAINRIKTELAPTIPGEPGRQPTPGTPGVPSGWEDAPDPEVLNPSFTQRIKDKVKDLAQPVVDKAKDKLKGTDFAKNLMLDPSKPADEPTIKYRIKYAGENQVLLYMLYNGQWRHVEPYSYRRRNGKLFFYGYCRIHDVIHAFDMKKIKGAVVTDEPYTPRWPIEVA